MVPRMGYAWSGMNPAALEVVGYQKAYDTVLAVQNLSFRVEAGEVFGLVGPNGAGKTTTLRAAAGIIAPTAGQLLVAGHDIVKDPRRAKRSLAYVPDDPRLFDSLTVWEHLRFMGAAYGVPDWESRGESLLRTFELLEKRSALVQELSRGMRQKLALCCAYVHSPRLVLLDEPMTGLDPVGIRTLRRSIRERAQEGAGFVVSSHLLALVDDLCTHLLIMNKGRCVFAGTVEGARQAFAGGDSSLEEVFFRATEAPTAAMLESREMSDG